jgi:hypothetical protein
MNYRFVGINEVIKKKKKFNPRRVLVCSEVLHQRFTEQNAISKNFGATSRMLQAYRFIGE